MEEQQDEERTSKADDTKSKGAKTDNYDVSAVDFSADTGPDWSELSCLRKIWRVIKLVLTLAIVLSLLYFFICSLDVMTAAFQLLTGRLASDVLADNPLLNNPVAGLMLGIVITALLQSSSTTTSIVVSMVGASLLTVQQAIPIIMGANIGTSVTAIIVSLTQSMDANTLRRAFAGATVVDMFNWCTVVILLPIEALTHYLYHITYAMVQGIDTGNENSDDPQFLKVITTPLTYKIIQVDKAVLSAVAEKSDMQKYPITKYWCKKTYEDVLVNITGNASVHYDKVSAMPWTVDIEIQNETADGIRAISYKDIDTTASSTCSHLFVGCGGVADSGCSLSDEAVGGILLACSLATLLIAIILMVKALGSMMKGPVAKAIQLGINADFPGCFAFLTGYVAILLGAGVTILVQSSSVFTSTMCPLVGMGLITVDRMYPLALGSKVGTTITSILAALTADASMIRSTMQVALCHLFYVLHGIVIYYPIPFMRRIPIRGCKFLGNTTAKYKWFALLYLIGMFFIIPGIVFGLSLAGWQVMLGVLIPVLVLFVVIGIINSVQSRRPGCLPKWLRTWDFLPEPLRSLAPYDRIIVSCCFNKFCTKTCGFCPCCKHRMVTDEVVDELPPPEVDDESHEKYRIDDELVIVVPGEAQTENLTVKSLASPRTEQITDKHNPMKAMNGMDNQAYESCHL